MAVRPRGDGGCRRVAVPQSPGSADALNAHTVSRALAVVFVATAHWVAAGETAAQVPDSLRRDTLLYQMEDLRVRTTRPVSTTSGASAVRLSLEIPRLEPIPLLADALRAMPFVQVRENSRGEAQLTLRGTSSRQVAILVDGVPLTLGWDARTDLSVVPTDAAREIQLYRGISSVLHGPNVLGGVVEIDLSAGASGSEPPGNSIQGGVDATGAAVVGGKVGSVSKLGSGSLMWQAGGGYRSRDGVPTARGVTQPVEPVEGQRLNSDLRHASGFLTGRYEAESGAWASLSSFAFSAERGVPPELHIADPRLWRIPETRRMVTALSGGTEWFETPFGGEGDVEVSLGLDVGSMQIDAFETLAYETVEESEFWDDRTVTARALADHTIGTGMLRTAFTWAETKHEERIDTEIDTGAVSEFKQRLYSIGAEVEQPLSSTAGSFWSGVRLSAGGSFDHASTPLTGGVEPRDPIGAWGARVGGSAILGAAGRLHFGVSRRVRFPSLRELYSGALGRFVPNPDLQPEELRAIETGITGVTDALSGEFEAQAVLFHQRFSNAIVRTGLGDGRFQRQNRNEVRAAGIELLAALRVDGWAFGGDLTLQDVVLKDALAPTDQRKPEYQPAFAGSLNLEAPILAGIRGRADLDVIGRQYCVDPELGSDVALGGTARLDLVLSREWSIGGPFRVVQGTAGLHNATDAAVYDQCGLPQPGRLFRVAFRVF
ncbi:MAG: TonB-dependent receptor plug domain-containing protein [Gemmatimonadota bacterium]